MQLHSHEKHSKVSLYSSPTGNRPHRNHHCLAWVADMFWRKRL